MGLEEVIAEINEKAKSDAEAIIKDGKAKAAEILKTAEKEIKAKELLAASDVADVRSASEKRDLADSELKCKKQIQDAKKELLDAAFDGMRKKISAMGEKERSKILESLYSKGMAEVGEVGAVYVCGSDMKIAAALFRAKKVAVKQRNIIGGLVAESSDGKMLADYSFDTIIESMKERTIKDVSRIIF